MAGRGIQDIPIRFPAAAPPWFSEFMTWFIRDVLSKADVRNAIEGGGVTVTGNSDENATLSATADVAALLNLSYVTMASSGSVPNERVLTNSSQITVHDAGPGGSVTLTIADGSITPGNIGTFPALSALVRRAADDGFPFPVVAASDGQVLRRGANLVEFGALDLASANAVTGDLPLANLTQGSALSVLGVTGNATADYASIAAGTDNQVLRRSGTALSFGAVNLASSNAVTGTLPVGNGGTGFGAYTVGDLLYASSTSALSKLAATTNGFVLTLSAGVPVWAAAGGASSGTYTPTLNATSNVSSLTALQCQYLRAGNVVTVSGRFNLTASSAAITTFTMSLPIPSSFGSTISAVAGTAALDVYSGTGGNVIGCISGYAGSNIASVSFASASTSSGQYSFHFTYLVV